MYCNEYQNIRVLLLVMKYNFQGYFHFILFLEMLNVTSISFSIYAQQYHEQQTY